MASCARVTQCAEAVPVLLQTFFSAVTQVSHAHIPSSIRHPIVKRNWPGVCCPGLDPK